MTIQAPPAPPVAVPDMAFPEMAFDPVEAHALLAEAIAAARLSPDRLAARIAALDLAALLALAAPEDAMSLVFEVAQGFAAIDPDTAWRALGPLPDRLNQGAPARSARAEAVLLLGLTTGACRAAVAAAYGYARARESGGKPIAQYQAVALRLAELAMADRAISLLARHVAADPDRSALTDACRYVAATAIRMARDAVQVAAGHGFVRGLPFADLFTGIAALAARLTLAANALDSGETP